MNKLKFHLLDFKEVIPNTLRDAFVLRINDWDDYGYQITFGLEYISKTGQKKQIGQVKILHKDAQCNMPVSKTIKDTLSEVFSGLNQNFISLGQSEKYYNNLHKLGDVAETVLNALNDIAWQQHLAIVFEPKTFFRNAMMRENEANRARRFGRNWVLGQNVFENFDFSYSCFIDRAEAPIDAKFPFESKDKLPGRIIGIIGRNAVGKTQFLAKLAEDLVQISRASEEALKIRETRFPSGRPLFTRIITISYSAFDRFIRPNTKDASHSYVYAGIRNSKGVISRTYLVGEYRRNLKRIKELGLTYEWIEYMKFVLGDSSENMYTNLMNEIADESLDNDSLSLLSSGQSILSHFVTALMAWIQPNSLVLFDEPETHLHPNAVANLFIILYAILKKHDSYAIVATHSPVVIQEIPAKRVLVFKREGNFTYAEPLPIESFGESISELTRHVFETSDINNLYRNTLKILASNESIEKVISLFDQGLSLNAEAFLLAQYNHK